MEDKEFLTKLLEKQGDKNYNLRFDVLNFQYEKINRLFNFYVSILIGLIFTGLIGLISFKKDIISFFDSFIIFILIIVILYFLLLVDKFTAKIDVIKNDFLNLHSKEGQNIQGILIKGLEGTIKNPYKLILDIKKEHEKENIKDVENKLNKINIEELYLYNNIFLGIIIFFFSLVSSIIFSINLFLIVGFNLFILNYLKPLSIVRIPMQLLDYNNKKRIKIKKNDILLLVITIVILMIFFILFKDNGKVFFTIYNEIVFYFK